MLYAYWPAGTVEWDDVVVKQVAPPPFDRGKKDRRPSLETKVRSREIEEKERLLRPDEDVRPRKRRPRSAGSRDQIELDTPGILQGVRRDALLVHATEPENDHGPERFGCCGQ